MRGTRACADRMDLNIKEELFSITDALDSAGVKYAACGGIAVAVHGYPRSTLDIDLLVLKKDVERAVEAVRPLGFVLPAGIIPFDVGKPTERRIFRVSKPAGEELLTLDLLIVTPLLRAVWQGRQTLELGGRRLVTVSRDGLARMKRAAGRHRDLDDLEKLGLTTKEES